MDISRKEIPRLEPYKIIMCVIIVVLLYLINSTSLLFHSLSNCSVLQCYPDFSDSMGVKTFLENGFQEILSINSQVAATNYTRLNFFPARVPRKLLS